MTTLRLTSTPDIAYFTRLWIDFSINNLTSRKTFLTTGANPHVLLNFRKCGECLLTGFTAERNCSPIAMQFIAIAARKKVGTGGLHLTYTAHWLMMTFA